MTRTVMVFVLGAVIGASIMYAASLNTSGELAPLMTPPVQQLSCEPSAANQRKIELAGTLGSPALNATAPSLPSKESSEPVAAPAESNDHLERKKEVLGWRISAIEKFVPLSEDQKKRLADKFEREQESREQGQEAESESLEEILGEENAMYYRGQVQAAFARVQNEEIQKEALWAARQLQLSSDQESELVQVFSLIEKRIDEEFPKALHGVSQTSQDRVKRMIAENKRRTELRAEELKRILPPDRYEAYLREAAESAASDMEVFHDPGSHDPGN